MVRLRRTSPDQPGWTRRRAGAGFVYLDEGGARLPAEDAQRVRDLVIPPAWSDVWVTPYAHGHLQAVGTDDAGRRQYLYHPEWRVRRDAEKFDRMLLFGKGLVKARELVLADLGREGMPRERACAAAVRLLDLGYFRIGNDVYADEHGSFGLTTLERRHVKRHQDRLVFAFVGKSGVEHRIEIDDETVIEAVEIMRRRRSRDHPGLLAYKDGRSWRSIIPDLVNEYVRQTTGLEATAKDFRTWHATVLAAAALAETPEPGETKASRKRAVAGAMKEVSEFLGNTPTLARSSYVDPRVIDAYERGRTIRGTTRRTHDTPDERQAALERATLRLIKEGVLMELSVVEGDITVQDVDAVVNAANRAMRGGGGVDGAIHRAAGPRLLEDCRRRFPHGLATGDAGWTTGADLTARWVIHVVGPDHHRGETDRSLLTSCYARALAVADELGARTIAFPLVSAGAYGWPLDDAVGAAVETLRATPTDVVEARLVAFGRPTYDRISVALAR